MRALQGLMGLLVSLGAVALYADTVELANGDQLNGKVVSLGEKEVVLQSEWLGELRIAREKVATISFGARKPQAMLPASGDASTAGPKAKLSADGHVQAPTLPKEPTVEDILQQLKKGVSLADMKTLEGEFPLLQTPEVKEYFNKTVTGLMKGEISIDNLRQQALDARKQVRDLEKELGPVGVEALKPYTSILDKFIRESESPSKEKANPPAVAPTLPKK